MKPYRELNENACNHGTLTLAARRLLIDSCFVKLKNDMQSGRLTIGSRSNFSTGLRIATSTELTARETEEGISTSDWICAIAIAVSLPMLYVSFLMLNPSE